MQPVGPGVATKMATVDSARFEKWRPLLKLNKEQGQKLLRERGIWITEACDRCGQLLGSVRWTRRGDAAVWCSQSCRDEIKIGAAKANSITCLECGVSLKGKRSDSEFCDPTHRMRFRRKARTGQNREISANMALRRKDLAKEKFGPSRVPSK